MVCFCQALRTAAGLAAALAGLLTSALTVRWSVACLRDPRWPEPLRHKLPLVLLAAQRLASAVAGTAAVALRLRQLHWRRRADRELRRKRVPSRSAANGPRVNVSKGIH
jgi:hypothetical protein